MSHSIHETLKSYWRKHRQNYSDPAVRAKKLAESYDQLHQKRLHKRNERRRRQSAKAGTPIFVTSHVTDGEPQTDKPDGHPIGHIDHRDLEPNATENA